MDPVQRQKWQDRYRNGYFLAPMVRVGTLPMRLLSLRYGADLVWTCEVVDKSIIGCERTVNDKTGVISFTGDGREIFTTHPDEKSRVVFQMGSASPETALEAAKVVEQDVAGIDLNCGCPIKFSIQGGMGAALMEDPDRLCAILDILVKNMSIPVTCKIRVFDDEEKTMALVRRIAQTGISALTVHCRTRYMRPREKAMWHRLNRIVEELKPLPVVLNGDIYHYSDVQRARESTGATSVMTARGAAANPSIFRAEGELTVMETAVEFVKTAMRVSNPYQNTKYTLLQLHPDTRSPEFRTLQASKCYEPMCAAMGLSDFYHSEGKLCVSDRNDPMRGKQKAAPGKRPATNTETPPAVQATADATEAPTKRVRA
ncbi:tRNA-dihydrouridine synthase 2 [Coemansia erecta]|nr:tRNA-dihydrouridine synthase 2 [Coemansia sp. RSA 2618]KAJ2828215.1 tRNA-dihydrouridine synthase 2 [Coemansia erecta]